MKIVFTTFLLLAFSPQGIQNFNTITNSFEFSGFLNLYQKNLEGSLVVDGPEIPWIFIFFQLFYFIFVMTTLRVNESKSSVNSPAIAVIILALAQSITFIAIVSDFDSVFVFFALILWLLFMVGTKIAKFKKMYFIISALCSLVLSLIWKTPVFFIPTILGLFAGYSLGGKIVNFSLIEEDQS